MHTEFCNSYTKSHHTNMKLPHRHIEFDFHTHRLDTPPGTGIVCLPQDAILHPDRWLDAKGRLPHAAEGALYAAGIHPWWIAEPDFDLESHLSGLETLLRLPEVVQLGECGIDRLLPRDKTAPLELQINALHKQIALSQKHKKPLTLHCVRGFDILLQLRKEVNQEECWTIHGFRGNPALTRQLLTAGFDLSFGTLRNKESYSLTPVSRRHEESDNEI